MQNEAPSTVEPNWPGLHFVHVRFSFAPVPSSQETHAVLFALLVFPRGHSVHASVLITVLNLPSGHCEQIPFSSHSFPSVQFVPVQLM